MNSSSDSTACWFILSSSILVHMPWLCLVSTRDVGSRIRTSTYSVGLSIARPTTYHVMCPTLSWHEKRRRWICRFVEQIDRDGNQGIVASHFRNCQSSGRILRMRTKQRSSDSLIENSNCLKYRKSIFSEGDIVSSWMRLMKRNFSRDIWKITPWVTGFPYICWRWSEDELQVIIDFFLLMFTPRWRFFIPRVILKISSG